MDELLTFGVGVDTSAAEEGLASLGGSADGVAAGLEDRLAGASDGMKNLGKSSAGASRGIQGLASVISLVDPRLGQVVRSVGTLTRGLTFFRLGMGAAIPVVAAVTGALYLYQQRQEEVAEQERRDKAISDAMAESRMRLRDATIDLDEEVRGLTESERRLNAIRRQAFVDNLPAVKEFTTQVADQSRSTEMARAAMETYKEEVVRVAAALEEGRANQANLNMATSRLRDGAELYQREAEALEGLQGEYNEFLGNTRKMIDARTEELDIADRRAQSRREEVEETQRLSAAERELVAMIQEVAAAEKSANESLLTDEERIKANMDERIARLEEISEKTAGLIDIEKAEIAIRREAAMELTELDNQRHEARMQQIETEQEAARQAALQQLQVGTDLASSLAGLAVQTAGDTKSARIAEARFNQLLAITNAIARNPGPIGALQGAAAAASIEARIAAMRSITAHRGALYGDEYMVKARSGEAHLSNQGRQMIGDDNIRRANRGQSPAGGIIEVRQFFRHQPFDPFVRRNLERGGPLNTAINDSRTGRGWHRGNRNGA